MKPNAPHPEQPSRKADASFPRGGAGPPQPLPRGANALLLAVSLGALAGVIGLLAWLLL